MAQSEEIRPLHLHTMDSLTADLISNRPIGVGRENTHFVLQDQSARAILNWYRRNPTRWSGNLNAQDAEAIVDAALTVSPILPPPPASNVGKGDRRLTLTKIEAHRFAGLHAFGTVENPPENFIYEPKASITLFEGLNASGKTSLLNAIIWALTGTLLRPQRQPEGADTDFSCRVDAINESGQATEHNVSPLTPLPELVSFRPSKDWIPADTWVELTFSDQDGNVLAPIRRTQQRTVRGKLEETKPDLAALGVDPIAIRIGTVMPGLLQFIQVGADSELGKAVAQLTGLSALVDLSDHAYRTKRRIDGDFTKQKNAAIESADTSYNRARDDLNRKVLETPVIAPKVAVPPPSNDTTIEATLGAISDHFDTLKADALRSAQDVLGATFDPENAASRKDLEGNVGPALAELRQLIRLPSAARLSALGKLTQEVIAAAREHISRILTEAAAIAELAKDPSKAARERLYARIASWMREHPSGPEVENKCVVCGGDIRGVVDPITGQLVQEHIKHAHSQNADLLSQTMVRWVQSALGGLTKDLSQTLLAEISVRLPSHPSALIRAALVEELFITSPFSGVLQNLKKTTEAICDAEFEKLPPLPEVAAHDLPLKGGPEIAKLQNALNALERALLFAEWRAGNGPAVTALFSAVVGLGAKSGATHDPSSLTGRLLALEATIKGAAPISDASAACGRLKSDLSLRRSAEKRLADYAKASGALNEVIQLGSLAQQQVDQLRSVLQKSAAKWRSRIYRGAFPSTQQELVASAMNSEGRLDLYVGKRGVAAPAQHVTNASALRATLVGFYLAFWEYVLRERGGLRLLLLDDPQELLDEENRERLAHALSNLLDSQAQLVVTTYDRRFAGLIAANAKRETRAFDHRSVHPVTVTRSTVETPLSIAEIDRRQKEYELDPDDAIKAQNYASECRCFLEARLGDLFDDAAYPASSTLNSAPALADHLNRLRGLISTAPSDLFKSKILKSLCDDPALGNGASALAVLNKAHHRKHEITPQDVSGVAADFERLRESAERVHEEFRRWRRGEQMMKPRAEVIPLPILKAPTFQAPVLIHPDLAAFTQGAATGESQEVPTDLLKSNWFEDKSLFYLRTNNFGFAAPMGAIAIVESTPSAVGDRHLVIAKYGKKVLARRLLRAENAATIALTAETPDPRHSPPTVVVPESEVLLYRVMGIIFDDSIKAPESKKEAVLLEDATALKRIERAYRIKEDSAIPLALPKQLVLGGKAIAPVNLGRHVGALAAVHLAGGGSLFKRIGPSLPAPLSHVRQFESIGGLGESQVLSVNAVQPGLDVISAVVEIVGVLYSDS